MKITNKAGLPQPFVDFATRDYEYKEKRYSVTTLLNPVRQILLKRRHDSDITQDVSEMVWLIFGTAVHKILEQTKDRDALYKEEKFTHTLENGYTISGIVDLYDLENEIVTDYKTASIWKVIFGDYKDWRRQGLAYAWLLKKCGLECKQAKFYALLKDWNSGDAKRKSEYPKQAVESVVFDVTESGLKEIDEFINNKINELIKYENIADDELPLCSEEDRWYTGDKFAVMKNGRKSALRVFDNEEEAKSYMQENGGDYIENRKGEDRKCKDYCQCCEFCSYWKEHYKEEESV